MILFKGTTTAIPSPVDARLPCSAAGPPQAPAAAPVAAPVLPIPGLAGVPAVAPSLAGVPAVLPPAAQATAIALVSCHCHASQSRWHAHQGNSGCMCHMDLLLEVGALIALVQVNRYDVN